MPFCFIYITDLSWQEFTAGIGDKSLKKKLADMGFNVLQ
jgi:hypothetical protein